MAKTIELERQDSYIDTLTLQRTEHEKHLGIVKNKAGEKAPRSTNANARDLTSWWYKEYARAFVLNPGYSDPARKTWERAAKRVKADTKDADPDAEYRDNHWFWNDALTKLAIHLEGQITKPSSMNLFVEALGESASERIEDARDFVEGAGEIASDTLTAVSKAADAVSDMGERAWSGIKTVAIVGGGLVGAAIILPPIIRAVRD